MKIEVIWVATYLQLEYIEVTKSTDPNLLQKLWEISTPTPHRKSQVPSSVPSIPHPP